MASNCLLHTEQGRLVLEQAGLISLVCARSEMVLHAKRVVAFWAVLFIGLLTTFASPVCAQGIGSPTSGPFSQSEQIFQQQMQQNTLLAQRSVPNPTAIPTDITPAALGQGPQFDYSEVKAKLFQVLPEKLWFDSSTEVSQRLETNVFFQRTPKRADYVFRVLPNVTLGYNVFKRFSIYCNYFVIKDVFADHTILTQPTTQSVSLGFRNDIPLGRRTNLQLDFQSRELWQAQGLRQADLIPTVSISHAISASTVFFGSALLQMRGREYFTGPNRELDPFFSIGMLHKRGQWNFTATNTYVANFRNHNAIPPISNHVMISDFELSRPINKHYPELVTFLRAEPIWNWGAGNQPGLSGFDFRLFGGIRLAFSKPAYNSEIEKLREQILESEGVTKGKSTTTSP